MFPYITNHTLNKNEHLAIRNIVYKCVWNKVAVGGALE
jgi:hypothetical protein